MHKQLHIALFGGTFNPIHNGHLRAAASAAEIAGIDRIVFIPSYLPPHRPVEGGTSATDRFEMVRLACHLDDRFHASDFEIHREERSFSIYTVQHFLDTDPPGTKISFLIGTDAFAEINTWHRAEELVALCDFLVMVRPGTPADLETSLPPVLRPHYLVIESERLVHEQGTQTRLVRIDGMELSSTEVRDLLRRRESPVDLIPAEVLQYIRRHGLYREPTAY